MKYFSKAYSLPVMPIPPLTFTFLCSCSMPWSGSIAVKGTLCFVIEKLPSLLISDRSSGLQTSWYTLLLLGTPAGRRWHGWHHRHVRLGDYVLASDIGQHFRHFFHHLWYTCPVTTASNSQRLCCIVSAFYQPITRIYLFSDNPTDLPNAYIILKQHLRHNILTL